MDSYKKYAVHAHRCKKYLKSSLTLIHWNAFKFKDEDDVPAKKVYVTNSLS